VRSARATRCYIGPHLSSGTRADVKGNQVDACDGYTAWGLPCNRKVIMIGKIGAQGAALAFDTVPITTLLMAAGVYSSKDWLDTNSSSGSLLHGTCLVGVPCLPPSPTPIPPYSAFLAVSVFLYQPMASLRLATMALCSS
jgi:hypothetical protein